MRTYYPRTYEANYLLGMLAGILNLTDRVGYVAANPVYGVPAAVNAFARGLRTVRPNSAPGGKSGAALGLPAGAGETAGFLRLPGYRAVLRLQPL